jgi:hypothetical protein
LAVHAELEVSVGGTVSVEVDGVTVLANAAFVVCCPVEIDVESAVFPLVLSVVLVPITWIWCVSAMVYAMRMTRQHETSFAIVS